MRQSHDAASNGVRDGYRVIDEQIRRGRRMAQELDDELWNDDRHDRERRRRARYQEETRSGYNEEPWPRSGGGGFGLLGMPLRQMERLCREILRQIVSMRPDPWRLIELLFRLQIEMMSELARCGFGVLGMAKPRWGDSFEEDVQRVERDIDESLNEIDDEDDDFLDEDEDEGEIEDERRNWPAAPSVPAVIRSTVPIPVYVWSYERTEIDLELPAGAQSLDLVAEPPLATGTDQPALPAFEADFVALADGPVILRIEVPRGLPAGQYLRRILVRATGEPVGDLTVQVGTVPKPSSKPSPKPGQEPGQKARKR
ncbi:MAG TPA: hypothetical protein VEW48_26455 [Thermoanaerobaculia bacterium]|nr:hypothetical protein [Thermoanaerobaculia bacterium]